MKNNRMLSIICLVFLWVMSSSNQLTAQFVPKDSSKCNLTIDTLFLDQAIVVDSTIYEIIDSVLSLIIKPNNNQIIPYYFELYPIEDSIFGQTRVTIQINNWFRNKVNISDAENEFYKNSILLNYKKNQILINKIYLKSWLNKYIKSVEEKCPYYVYGFFKNNRKIMCSSKELYKQKVTFYLWWGHRKPFSFDEYSYTIYDESFIYDNELEEASPKKKR